MKKYKRWNGKRKTEVAVALLKGEPLAEVSRAAGQPAHVLNAWKEVFPEGGSAAFREGARPRSGNWRRRIANLKPRWASW